MKERPILFSATMVQAIEEGRKTQTRRVMKPQPTAEFGGQVGFYHPTLTNRRTGQAYPGPLQFGAYDADEDYRCPYGEPGDRLWVKRGRFMPKKAAQLWLVIQEVRVELLQWIRATDALAEGIDTLSGLPTVNAITAFQALWDTINARRGHGWAQNPWVWVIEFRVEATT